MNCIYRLYVGLSREHTQTPIDSDEVIAWVSEQVDSLTVLNTQGFFHGKAEDTLVFVITHDDQRFIIDLAHRLRARLDHEGLGLEYDGVYHRITHTNDPWIGEVAKRSRQYPNFNVKVLSNLRTHRNWCRANDIGVRVFENFDGGGFNFYIYEFNSLKEAEAFALRFKIQDEHSLWIETVQGGEIQYIEPPPNEAPKGQGVLFIKKPDLDYTNDFTERFRSCALPELVASYNSQVGNRGWVSAKGRYLSALYIEFKRRGIDISLIDTGEGMRLDQYVTLSTSGSCLLPARKPE